MEEGYTAKAEKETGKASGKAMEGLLEYIKKGVSPYHTVHAAKEELEAAGCEELELSEPWKLQRGQGYFVRAHGSTLFAFRVNPGFVPADGFRIAAAHTDWPCMRIKTAPEMQSGRYRKLNVETYGGPILSTWMDRPLSAAGRAALRGSDPFHPELCLVDLGRPVFTIPNLAIHMNRDVNKGVELNRQTDMLPLAGEMEKALEKDGGFMEALGQCLGRRPEDILFFELSVYNCDPADIIGINGEFLSAPRLDNLTSVKACMDGFLAGGGRERGADLAVFFDHEEIGSRTKQGAGSLLLDLVMEKICAALGYGREEYVDCLLSSFFLSVDVAHAAHPNRPEKSDPTNPVYLNGGVVLKTECNQRYATDAQAVGILRALCGENGIPCQFFANRSDMGGGSTLGSIASSFTVMNTADIGLPLLAMHSARETMGVRDMEALTALLACYWK